jgi:hypothetical protein
MPLSLAKIVWYLPVATAPGSEVREHLIYFWLRPSISTQHDSLVSRTSIFYPKVNFRREVVNSAAFAVPVLRKNWIERMRFTSDRQDQAWSQPTRPSL